MKNCGFCNGKLGHAVTAEKTFYHDGKIDGIFWEWPPTCLYPDAAHDGALEIWGANPVATARTIGSATPLLGGLERARLI